MLLKIPKDTIVLFSTGEYSDYNVKGLYKAKQDIDPDELRNEYINLYPEQTAPYSFKDNDFVKFLKEKDLVEPVPGPNWMEWYLESYANISEMRVFPGPIMFN